MIEGGSVTVSESFRLASGRTHMGDALPGSPQLGSRQHEKVLDKRKPRPGRAPRPSSQVSFMRIFTTVGSSRATVAAGEEVVDGSTELPGTYRRP